MTDANETETGGMWDAYEKLPMTIYVLPSGQVIAKREPDFPDRTFGSSKLAQRCNLVLKVYPEKNGKPFAAQILKARIPIESSFWAQVQKNDVPKGHVSVTSHEGEIEYGEIEVPDRIVVEAIKSRATATTIGDDYFTLEFGGENGLTIHINRGE